MFIFQEEVRESSSSGMHQNKSPPCASDLKDSCTSKPPDGHSHQDSWPDGDPTQGTSSDVQLMAKASSPINTGAMDQGSNGQRSSAPSAHSNSNRYSMGRGGEGGTTRLLSQ